MFPLFILGSWFGKFLDELFKKELDIKSLVSSVGYSSHVVTDSLLYVKFGIEENYILKTNAYQDAKRVWTIGIGVVNVFDENGNFVLKAYKGLTLSFLKNKMGKNQLSDLQFAYHLMRNHVRKSKSYQVFKELDSHKIPYDPNLADAIIDFYYNSGSAYGTKSYFAFIQELRQKSSLPDRKKAFAIAYIRYRLDYLQSFSKVVYGSWLRRVQIFGDRIANNDLTMENKKSWKMLPTSVKVRSYILATYYYSLVKPLA